jgi:hypothetical protein
LQRLILLVIDELFAALRTDEDRKKILRNHG